MNNYAYLDNAATTFPKPKKVLEEVDRCLREYCGNPGRGSHALSLKSMERIYDTREAVARYLNHSAPEHVIFTANATHALNQAILGKIDHKCHIITSDLEHNSVIRPLRSLTDKYGCEVSCFNSDGDPYLEISALKRRDTEFLVTSIASNVTGKIIDPERLFEAARANGLYTIIDASQYLGHKRLDFSKTPFDIVCSAGHKALFGIQGTGILVFSSDELITPLLEGGSGGDSKSIRMPTILPERYEAGTLNTPGIVSLGVGIDYLEKLGQGFIDKRLHELTLLLGEILEEAGATVYGCENGIASFNLEGFSASELAEALDDEGVAVRGGFHCAPSIHDKIGTMNSGAVRASLSVLSRKSDIHLLYSALKRIKEHR